MDSLLTWLTKQEGTFKGTPIPRWTLCLVGLLFVVTIVLDILNKVRKK
jgi:preprotein translocase subunit SecG